MLGMEIEDNGYFILDEGFEHGAFFHPSLGLFLMLDSWIVLFHYRYEYVFGRSGKGGLDIKKIRNKLQPSIQDRER